MGIMKGYIRQVHRKASTDKIVLNNMESVYVRNTIKSRTYICDLIGKVCYRTREHLKPRSHNVLKEINKYFQSPVQPFTHTHHLLKFHQVSLVKPLTPIRAETSVSQTKAIIPVNVVSSVKPSIVKETDSY